MALGFFTEADVDFVDADLVEAGFFIEEDFADVVLDGADFFDPDLEDVVGLDDSGFEAAGGSARRR